MDYLAVTVEWIDFNVEYDYEDGAKLNDFPEVNGVFLVIDADCDVDLQHALKATVMVQITSALRREIERQDAEAQ